jgi:steroid 5-alpha reductase family enzyme
MTRLGSFLFLRIKKDGQDARFDVFKICQVSWMGCWSSQAIWVIMIQLPILLINERDDSAEYKIKDYITISVFMVLWVIGFICETAADNEKFVFKCRAENRGKYINSGIWRYSRHPNYFGEILMWLCISLLVISKDLKDGPMYSALVSPGFTMFLLLGVSGIPMVDASGWKRWGHLEEYKAYMKNTSVLIPWFPHV